ncbi:SAM-dependent methyltransferase [Mycobacterium heckeshornense]|uniref:S-adenosyl-L-methionine-dependent methyltransferase n=1 Tax=Mycobacterium heckeshornense TaxID=110505 RepID=A0A2G8B1D9_9MYCO|nr:class I SAM-dependent methyltransferase [Mycobacterium heckeshornense]KMV22039.1 SAM-dependent methyltransferase [Mycobacterium heckeshornense]MCV7034541.1 class I SAM-dependent methyltransferase [Mycobacterium heckeshornense]PIJ31579.1 SAM-dependent methyltransferase [Mycobacterium heckeshornense]BCO33790.1 putative S-adenosyl-L-methionine-dependent methyltransferase [Mycobacterium heckeshornense]BCQ06834.1 putative S-adenosyl-L-methionine-dependent methyltransferase [Mycobacterium heckesh
MARADDDTWDITESVGATALGVAAARAAETDSDDPLIVDPFARLFVDAAGQGLWSMYSGPLGDMEPDVRAWRQAMVDFMAVRTAFFDEFFLDAAHSGVRQMVILAAGLDARAWRLPWPAGVTVYELDQPKVLQFKSRTLQRHGARPGARQVSVPVDLRHDWPKALQEAGFDASKPSAWLAEGLLRYLPAAAQDLLIQRVHALSPAGSRLAANSPAGDFLNPERLKRQRQRAQRLRTEARRLTGTEVPDVEELWYPEERTDLADWLRQHNWDASSVTMAEMLARYARSIPDEEALPPTVFVRAQRLAR